MKLLIIIFSMVLVVSCENSFSQQHQKRFNKKPDGPRERLEELEKIKLLEILELDEKSMLQFFSRRKEFTEILKNLEDERNTKLNELNELIDNNADNKEYKKVITEIIQIEDEINKQKAQYISSLDGILSYKQISQLFVFERNFRREIKEIIFKHRR